MKNTFQRMWPCKEWYETASKASGNGFAATVSRLYMSSGVVIRSWSGIIYGSSAERRLLGRTKARLLYLAWSVVVSLVGSVISPSVFLSFWPDPRTVLLTYEGSLTFELASNIYAVMLLTNHIANNNI